MLVRTFLFCLATFRTKKFQRKFYYVNCAKRKFFKEMVSSRRKNEATVKELLRKLVILNLVQKQIEDTKTKLAQHILNFCFTLTFFNTLLLFNLSTNILYDVLILLLFFFDPSTAESH